MLPRKPILDLSKGVLSANPSKNYWMHLMFHHIKEASPARSLDAGVGQLRNFWMFRGKYVGITHNRPAYFRGLQQTPNPQLIAKRGEPEVYLMRLQSDFSFLGLFDLCVCTQTLLYVDYSLDVLSRLSEVVGKGGTLIIDAAAAHAEAFQAVLSPHYDSVDTVYYGYEGCNAFDDAAPTPDLAAQSEQFMMLTEREMNAPNVAEGHSNFYMIGRKKKESRSAPPGPTPVIENDRGLNIVVMDIPYLKMDDEPDKIPRSAP